jgi:hypothetical protein
VELIEVQLKTLMLASRAGNAVGFGGSMVWFGSSAGVTLTSLYPDGRSIVALVKQGWFVPIAYVVGFFVMLLALGWNPAAG